MTPEMEDGDLEVSMDRQITDNLRRAYNMTLDEAVPDRFLELLRQLREAEGGQGSGPS